MREIRNPKSERNPKLEIPKSKPKQRDVLSLSILILGFFRISDFGFRISDFGFRISDFP